ncbi:MAG: hypothetical protein FJ125_03430 [Deltaproteobacteria bacterium]|nr:hypothetical protein [Deltaproteobacteria bacterium]
MARFTPRYPGVDSDHLAWMLVSVDGRIASRMDEIDYRAYEDYYQRAQLRYGAGFPAHEVLDDLWCAARCLRFQEKLHLTKVPVERFRLRRIQPLELAILGGEHRLMRQVAEGYGIPIGTLAADMAPPELKEEARQVTRYFDGFLRDELDLAGLAALMYVCALASLARGFADEAILAVRIFRQARRQHLPAGTSPHIERYRRLLDLVEAFVRQQEEQVIRGIGELLLQVEPTLRAGMSPEQWARPPGTPSYLDLSPFCFVALATLHERELPRDQLPAGLESQAEMLDTLATPQERNLEEEEAQGQQRVEELLAQTTGMQAELYERAMAKEAARGGKAAGRRSP